MKLQLWEAKMIHSGAISGTIDRQALAKQGGTIIPVHDLNVPYEGPVEEYETPTAEMLFPPVRVIAVLEIWFFSLSFGELRLNLDAQTPLQTPAPPTPLPPTPLPGTLDQPNYNIPTGTSEYGTPINEIRSALDLKSGRPSPYMV